MEKISPPSVLRVELGVNWARIGHHYIGFWDHGDYEYLFTFALLTE
jgi:hypothetical protein